MQINSKNRNFTKLHNDEIIQSHSNVLCLDVHPPIKTVHRYEFHCDVLGKPFTRTTAFYRLKTIIRGYGSPFKTRLRFGFRALNFNINHSEVWDSIFPLMYLIRNGGPLFKTDYDSAVIRFRYPVLEKVCDFFVRRADNFGLSIKVEADTFIRTYDIAGDGQILAFSGGKESRLLLGLLRDLGRTPRLSTGGPENASEDLPQVEMSQPFFGTLAERIIPALMSGAAHCYFGSGLGEVHFRRPWHQFYDVASWQGQRELSELFHSLGVDLRLHAPLCVLPYNIIQKILAVRYPELYAYQQSVKPQALSEKNLHVSLIKIYHKIPITAHCSEELFRKLVRDFVAFKLSWPDDFGFRDGRKFGHLEMMAIIAKRKDHPLLNEVREIIPKEWMASWLDFIHPYLNPNVDSALLEIFRMYASDYVVSSGHYSVPTPNENSDNVFTQVIT